MRLNTEFPLNLEGILTIERWIW